MKKILLKIWGAITLVLTVIAYAFFTKNSNSKMRQAVNKVKKDAEKEQEDVEEIKKNIDQRKGKDKELAEKLKNHFYIILVLFLAISFSWSALAEQEPDIENLKIPDDYDTLLIQYKDMAMIAIEYQQLYREAEAEAEADNKKLIETVERLQKLIDTQQEIIDKLMGRKLSMFTGVNVVPLDIKGSGLLMGVNYKF